MPFTSGSVFWPYGQGAAGGNTGLLKTLLDFILGTEVTGTALSGSGAGPYTATLTTRVAEGRVVVDYAFSAVAYQATDDGAGNLSGTNVSVGTINYETGAISITFTGTPDGAPTCDYLYGVERGRDWRLLLDQHTTDNAIIPLNPFGTGANAPREVIISNTGYSGREEVIIGIREWEYVVQLTAGWDLNGYIFFNPGMGWNDNDIHHSRTSYDTTWETWVHHPMLPIRASGVSTEMPYWFYVNEARIIVVLQLATQYESIYLGFGRRFGNPVDYPYPLVVMGSVWAQTAWDVISAGHRFCISNYISNNTYKGWVVSPENDYLMFYGNNDAFYFLPYDNFNDAADLDKATDDRYIMTPVYVVPYQYLVRPYCMMDLDGVFHIMGPGFNAGDLVNYNGRSYRLFPNVNRTEYYNWMAVEEGPAISTTTSTTSTSSTSSTVLTTTTLAPTTTTVGLTTTTTV